MNILKSKVKKNNNQYFDIADLAYIPEREINEDVVETGVMINPIEVYPIMGKISYGAGGALYRLHGCLGKKYIVHKGNSRVKAAIELKYTHIEGLVSDEFTPFWGTDGANGPPLTVLEKV
tara:strand:+ start:254 stop:613 length:360 start_codon:yes stop_codon:yes gene_type:complete